MMILVLAFITNFILFPNPYLGPSPYICNLSGAGMQATCRKKAPKARNLDAKASN
jgi:hypothetical protein